MQYHAHPPPAAAAPVGGLSTGAYEFNPTQEVTIAKMGSRAWWWGLVSIVTGVIGMLLLVAAYALRHELAAELATQGISMDMTPFIVGLAPVVFTHLVIAFNYMGAGRSLKEVVRTRGNDVEHLMQALNKLGTALMVEFIVGLVALVLGFSAGFYLASQGVDISTSTDFDFD